MSSLEGLNDGQKEAVLHTEGPLLIVAGAGAGKTKTLTHRIVHLVEGGVGPEHILAVTFTNKAAREMRERVEKALSDRGIWFAYEKGPCIRTFHAFAVLVLRESGEPVGVGKNFTIIDEEDARRMVKEAIVESNLDPKQYEPRTFKSAISKKKGDFISLATMREKMSSYFEELLVSVWTKYEAKLAAEKSLDFDDLLIKTVTLLEKNPLVLKKYQERFQYIHIDEYQDTNEVQYTLAKLLAGEKKNICAVGDSDQTIYSWRGANIKNILHFEKDFLGAKIVFLEENYRSTKVILSAANKIIEKNTARIPKNLFTQNAHGEYITLYEGYDERFEAQFIAEKTQELISSGAQPSDIAVLYRANFQSRALEDAFVAQSIRYQLLGTKFFARKEVRDVLAYVRAAQNRESLSDIKRIINFPARGIGKVTIAKLFSGEKNSLPAGTQRKIEQFYEVLDTIEMHAQELAPSLLLKEVITRSGIETELKNGTEEDRERLENIRELVTLALRYDAMPIPEGLETMLADAALASDQDDLKEDEDGGVRLMTVHASKGLEFSYVFISGLEEGLFPHEAMNKDAKRDDEEERRLFYVALTRAKKKLFLTYAQVRTIFGMRQVTVPSQFIYDIPDELLEKEEVSFGTRTVYL